MEAKHSVLDSLVAARNELNNAMAQLESLPAFDPGTVGYAAHAIHNYLTVTNATLDLIEPALTGQVDAETRKWFAALRQSTVLMEHTVNQLINASACQEPTFLMTTVNVCRLVQLGCEYYRALAARKDIRIECTSAVDEIYVRSDPVAIGAVLDNLLSNAVKYSASGTCISVTVAEMPDACVCHIDDRGPGLSPEDQRRLFQPGVRLSSRPSGGERQTGIGLAIAKELIEKLGGRIWCESGLGQGSRFSFSLPMHHSVP